MSGVSANTTADSADWASPGAGISGGYDGTSISLKITIVFFCGLAIHNSLELIAMILLTFARYRGLYFWSLLLSSFGILPHALGFLLKYMNVTTGNLKWIAVVLITTGSYPMITGQALVLWSRLNLIVSGERGDKIMKYTKWMIIIDAVVLHIPTTVLTFGSNGTSPATDTFVYGYNIMEKIQMCGFFCQEVVLSSIYIIETAKILRSSMQEGTRKMLRQLVLINVIIILMDLTLLGFEAASLYILQTLIKGVLYSIKLKLEFAILGKLVKFVAGRNNSIANNYSVERNASVGFVNPDKGNVTFIDGEMDIRQFVNLDRVATDVSYPSRASESLPTRRKPGRSNGMDFEYDFARFEHVEDVTALGEVSSSAASVREQNGHV